MGVRGGDWGWGGAGEDVRRDVGGLENIKAAILRQRRRSARWKCGDGGRFEWCAGAGGGAAGGRERGQRGERSQRGCRRLIIWLFMQKDESPPIRVGDL